MAAAGLDFAALSDEFAQNQSISEESYSKLAKANIPREVVDGYVRGQQLIGEQYKSQAHAAAGGAEQYTAMIDWAKQTLSTTQLAAYDKSVLSMDLDAMSLAVEGMRARHEAAVGKAPKLLQGSSTGSQPNTGFNNIKEQVAAMRDPRYRSDHLYRKQVEARIVASTSY